MKKIVFQTFSIAVLLFSLFSMALAAAPAAPKLLSPKVGVTEGSVTPTFRWSDVGAAWYHLYLIPGMGGGTITRSNLTKTSYRFASEEALSYDTSYAWSVRACNPGEPVVECTDSESWFYTTKKAPASVVPKPGDGYDCPEGQICNPLKYDTFQEILGAITYFIFVVGMALAPVMLIIAGFYFVTAAGDPKRVETGKLIIRYTLIGLAIILLASGLIKVLESILGVTGS